MSAKAVVLEGVPNFQTRGVGRCRGRRPTRGYGEGRAGMMYDEVEEWLRGARRALDTVDVTARDARWTSPRERPVPGWDDFRHRQWGSASTANHFACDLQKATTIEGRGTRAISLSDNTALLTAWGNDLRSMRCSPEQLRLLASPGDGLVLFSVSGSSPNYSRPCGRGRG